MKNRFLAVLAVLAVLAGPAVADYPSKPIKLVVPVPPGGASDGAARMIAHALAKSMGQPVVVENRPGASGSIAAQAVHAAVPDGYTLLWTQSSMAGLPMLLRSSPFRSLAEFAPVSMVCRLPAGLYVHPSVPSESVSQLVAHARANPDKLTYATGPLSEYMAGVQFMKATDTAMLRVPYKGGAQAIVDVVEGRVQVYFTPLAQGLQFHKAGRLRMLAVMMPARSALAPEVPTFAELGINGIAVPNWNGIVAPPRTPAAVTSRLSEEIRRAIGDPAIRAAFEKQYLQPEGSTPAELAVAVSQSVETWGQFIRENQIPQE
jgi:tripartite-type tricarboxylate transporter receptor subunit TctC